MPTQMNDVDAVLFGGPCDGATIETQGAELVEIQIHGLVYRYVPTAEHRTMPEGKCTVYTYDGMADPARAPNEGQTGAAR
jgi:hypothetical protein